MVALTMVTSFMLQGTNMSPCNLGSAGGTVVYSLLLFRIEKERERTGLL